MDELIKQLREPCQHENCVLCQQAADAIEARDRHILALQHEIMAEAESHAALVERLNKQIEELANVRPVVRGKWITVKHPLYECSICGSVYQDVGYGFNYCPNCGADMREPPKVE